MRQDSCLQITPLGPEGGGDDRMKTLKPGWEISALCRTVIHVMFCRANFPERQEEGVQRKLPSFVGMRMSDLFSPWASQDMAGRMKRACVRAW